jgi:hypothetical protein
MSWDMAMWSVPSFTFQDLEQQLPLPVSGPTTNSGTGISPTLEPTLSALQSGATINPLATNDGHLSGIVDSLRFTSCPGSSTVQDSAESEQLEATESFTPLDTSLVHGQASDSHTTFSRTSKHGQTEKYFCTYHDCSRSQTGSGFYRKDHLDQHLRGRHKQSSVPKLGAKSVALSSIRNSTTLSESTEALLQSRKRKRRSEEETRRYSEDGSFEELAEERRLRLLAEEETQRLRQKLENYEERMKKYEDRLDRMMSLIEKHEE